MVTASAYTPHPSEGGRIAADGRPAIAGRTCAVSRDLKHLLGKWLHIEGVGKRLAHDTMAARHKRSVDVCMSRKEDAREFGRRSVTVNVIR